MSDLFDDARQLEMVTTDLVWADWPRGINRALIASLADGKPPFTPEEADSARVHTNVNNLKHTGLLHDARSQYANGFLQQGQYYTAKTDRGPRFKREMWSAIVEKEMNRPLLESLPYFEVKRSQFALDVLHGIAPTVWRDQERVIPRSIGVADMLVPSNIELGFADLPFLVFRQSLTARGMADLLNKTRRDPAWNTDYIKDLMKWIDAEMRKGGLSSDYNPYYKPEKWEQDIKQQTGWYMADRVPTVDVFDIYCYVDGKSGGKKEGWVRRMILDSWGNPGPGVPRKSPQKRDDMDKLGKTRKGDFIYSSKERVVCDSWENVAAVQYADLTAVAPFLHNAVRSLGWLTYAQCHIDNRLDCRIIDSAFETLLQYFQVSSQSDVKNAMKVELANMGFIDDTIKFVKAQDRWQPNANFIEMVKQMVGSNIDNQSKSWTQNVGATSGSNTEKTKFQYMAELQKLTALVGAGLNQAHRYAKFEGKEIFRRLCRPNSEDNIARTFRVNCLRQGIPEDLLVPEAWTIDSERMMGQGNQTLELMTAQELLQLRPSLDPDAQRSVLRNFVLALTHNPAMAIELVPEKPMAPKAAQAEASRVASALMQGIQTDMVEGVNPIEYVTEMLKILAQKVQAGKKGPGAMLPAEKLQGLFAIAGNIGQHLKQLEQDPAQKQFVKQAGDALGKLANELKGFQQRLVAAMKAQQKAQGQNGQGDGGEGQAKAASTLLQTKAKIQAKDMETKAKIKRDNVKFLQETVHKDRRNRADIAATDLKTAAEIQRGRMKSLNEPGEKDDA